MSDYRACARPGNYEPETSQFPSLMNMG